MFWCLFVQKKRNKATIFGALYLENFCSLIFKAEIKTQSRVFKQRYSFTERSVEAYSPTEVVSYRRKSSVEGPNEYLRGIRFSETGLIPVTALQSSIKAECERKANRQIVLKIQVLRKYVYPNSGAPLHKYANQNPHHPLNLLLPMMQEQISIYLSLCYVWKWNQASWKQNSCLCSYK